MRLWTPAQLSTGFWYDASDSSTLFTATSGGSLPGDGIQIARWEDKSGNGRHLFQSDFSFRPLRRTSLQNGLPIVQFDGLDDGLQATTASDWTWMHTANMNVFCVCRITGSNNPNTVYGFLGTYNTSWTNRGFALYYDDRTPNHDNRIVAGVGNSSGVGTVASTSRNESWLPNTTNMVNIVFEPSAIPGQRMRGRLNGSGGFENGTQTLSVNNAAPTFPLRVGNVWGNQWQLPGNMCEMIGIPSLVSQSETEVVEGYLAHKWGIQSSLPNDHPYKNFAPGVSSNPIDFDGGYSRMLGGYRG